MITIAIIIGSTRPGRSGAAIASWLYEIARKRSDAQFQLVDLADFDLPLLDEPVAAIKGNYTKPHTQAWAAKIAYFDGYVFVTPEYNHAAPGTLKNAIDYLYREWNNKAAGFVGYGGVSGGVRAVENLRLIMGELMVADVRAQVAISGHADYDQSRIFRPAAHQEGAVHTMLDQVVAWSGALKKLRVHE